MKSLLLLYALFAVNTIFAQWSTNPTLNNVISQGSNPQIISDGFGGSIITWNNAGNLYAQKINSSGIFQWGINGITICSLAIGTRFNSQLFADSSGGAIIIWRDTRNGNDDLYTQRINASGTALWAANGLAICTAIGNQKNAEIISDNSGGFIVSWEDERTGTSDIYAQRISSLGSVIWSTNGVAICSKLGTQVDPKIISNGSGGAFLAWHEDSGATSYIIVQKINNSGAIQWGANGITICNISSSNYPKIINDSSGGIIVAWQDLRGIYAQRVGQSGVIQWSINGVGICTNLAGLPSIASFGSKGAIITWVDSRITNNQNIYAQLINYSGISQWTANGIPICTAAFDQLYPKITIDSTNEPVIAWQDKRSSSYFDIFAQKINMFGEIMWDTNGIAVSTAAFDQFQPTFISNGLGGSYVTWLDYRNGVEYIYAQYICKGGKIGGTGTVTLPPSLINGIDSLCSGISSTFSIAPVIGATSYKWILPIGWSGSSTSTNIVITPNNITGKIKVMAINDCGYSAAGEKTVFIKIIPTKPNNILGPNKACKGSTNLYTVPKVAGAVAYNWTYPIGWSGISTSDSIVVIPNALNGNISVTAINSCGISPLTFLSVSIDSIPVKPDSINGSNSICFGINTNYNVPVVSGATNYIWNKPISWNGSSSSNSISISADTNSGNISVSAMNYCGVSPPSIKNVKVNSIPYKPSNISGPISICHFNTNKYSIAKIIGANSYNWTKPLGWTGASNADSIILNSSSGSGTIFVSATNACGTSATTSLYVLNNPPSSSNIFRSSCFTTPYFFNNQFLNKTGIYKDTLVNFKGCDSFITLNLIVDTPIASIVQIGKICQGVPCTLTANNSNLYGNFLWSTGATSSSIITTSTAPITLQYTRLADNCPASTSAAYTPQAITNCGGRLVIEADTLVFPTDTIKVKIKMEGGDNVFSLFSKLKCYKNSNVKYTLARSEVGNYLGTSNITQPPIITNMGSYDLLDFGMSKTAGQSGTNGSGLVYTFYFVTQFIKTVSLDTFNQKYEKIQFELVTPIVNDALGTQRNIDILPLVETKIIQAVQVWPGDLNADKKVNVADILPIGYFYNRTGPLRPNATLQWKAQICGLWGDSFYVKKSRGFSVFADGNGNGKVDLADQNSIGFNLGSVHLKTEADDPIPTIKPNNGIPLNIDIAETKIIKSALPKTIKIPVYLTSIVSNPIANLYGIALDVYFQSAYVDIANIKILYDNSVFGTLNIDCIKIEENKSTTGRIGIGLTRYNTTELNSANKEKLFEIEVPFVKGAPNGWFKVTAVPIGANDKDGDEIAIRWGVDSIFIEGDGGTGFNESKIQDFQVHAFPNPAKRNLTCSI
ncbi:MAG: hypothetical protein IPK03_07090 [Bacteroidetes bacterium]|nr:hypothetical protein [Bacteroidota bacterium]